ncbi:sorting nexin 13 [Parelaphostrongylus tenuis]|uniref:Sorting nexin 13 n=1 Tax=Parelaphostrongylus tenuis TaxID=148309 RepID=A0AAD5RC00_PARTN|nr:sorting nexin 13 [Parelaphostrongylus tenuis]
MNLSITGLNKFKRRSLRYCVLMIFSIWGSRKVHYIRKCLASWVSVVTRTDQKHQRRTRALHIRRFSEPEQRASSEVIEERMINDGKPITSAVVETLGIGQQGKQSFALYNVRVSRSVNGKRVSGWNVLRRYSDFHTLHAFIVQKYPKLSNLSFPGKKTFNNLDAHFLEKRTKALNLFLGLCPSSVND